MKELIENANHMKAAAWWGAQPSHLYGTLGSSQHSTPHRQPFVQILDYYCNCNVELPKKAWRKAKNRVWDWHV